MGIQSLPQRPEHAGRLKFKFLFEREGRGGFPKCEGVSPSLRAHLQVNLPAAGFALEHQLGIWEQVCLAMIHRPDVGWAGCDLEKQKFHVFLLCKHSTKLHTHVVCVEAHALLTSTKRPMLWKRASAPLEAFEFRTFLRARNIAPPQHAGTTTAFSRNRGTGCTGTSWARVFWVHPWNISFFPFRIWQSELAWLNQC